MTGKNTARGVSLGIQVHAAGSASADFLFLLGWGQLELWIPPSHQLLALVDNMHAGERLEDPHLPAQDPEIGQNPGHLQSSQN